MVARHLEAISLQDIRQQNASKIFHTLRQHPGISQRELVDITGIDQGTISVIVSTLFDKNIVSRTKESSDGRVGRPRVALRLSQKGILLGASIEHNLVSVIATHLDGTILSRDQACVGPNKVDTMRKLYSLVEQLCMSVGYRPKDVLGLGIAAPVILQDGTKRILFSSNLNWGPIDLHELMGDFSMPVYLDNDANAAALAEKHFGICKAINNYLYIGGYSGIGGAIVVEGQLYRGARGFAGEIGHIEVVPHGRRCGCGSNGCLEAYVSEKAMMERLAERGTKAQNLNDIILLAKNGHQFANFMLFEAATILGRALAFADKLLNPEYIVLGSGLSNISSFIKDELEYVLHQNSLTSLNFRTPVIGSTLASDAVPMGGVVLALEGFLSQPEWFTSKS